jgi:hypothetical protein
MNANGQRLKKLDWADIGTLFQVGIDPKKSIVITTTGRFDVVPRQY